MARLNLDFGDVDTYINLIKSEVAEKAVEAITTELKRRGPYWTGEFEEAWEVTDGAPITASTPASGTEEERIEAGAQPRQVTRLQAGVDFPSAPKKGPVNYTIDNRMEYRDIAKDIVPGRVKNGGRETADQDWYVNYIQGGGLATTIQLATGKTTQDPKIKNFKGKIGK
jgi:hypothetical protein